MLVMCRRCVKSKIVQWSKCSKQAGQAEEYVKCLDYLGLKAIQESLPMALGVVATIGNYV